VLAQISEMRDVVSNLERLIIGDSDVDQVLHESFEHLVVTLVSSVLKGSDKRFERFLPVPLTDK